jgi:uncharacterized protein (DUF983 family)
VPFCYSFDEGEHFSRRNENAVVEIGEIADRHIESKDADCSLGMLRKRYLTAFEECFACSSENRFEHFFDEVA